MPRPSKLRTLPRLLPELEARRRLGQRIAFTNGCFDVLHAGHVQYLQEARAQADCSSSASTATPACAA